MQILSVIFLELIFVYSLNFLLRQWSIYNLILQPFLLVPESYHWAQLKRLVFRISHSGGGGAPSHPTIYFEPHPPPKLMPPHGAHTHLKMKPPHLKNNPPPIETCSTLPFAGLQANSRQFHHQMNSFTGIFQQHLKPPPAPPPHVLT